MSDYQCQKDYTITVYSPGVIRGIRDRHFPDHTEEGVISLLIRAGIEAERERALPDSPMLNGIYDSYKGSMRCTFETTTADLVEAEQAILDVTGEALHGCILDLENVMEQIAFKAGFQYAVRLLRECGVTTV